MQIKSMIIFLSEKQRDSKLAIKFILKSKKKTSLKIECPISIRSDIKNVSIKFHPKFNWKGL